MVLINDTASAPPSRHASAGYITSVIFGVSFTMTGTVAYFLHHSVACLIYSGTCPTAAPIPLSDIPCGQPKLSSNPSIPVSSIIGMCFAQDSSFIGNMTDATKALSGQSLLTWRISLRLT